jgi:hypothetical protein
VCVYIYKGEEGSWLVGLRALVSRRSKELGFGQQKGVDFSFRLALVSMGYIII